MHDVTIAAEIGSKVIPVGQDGQNMKLQIWDTAGQEHFRAVTRSYFRNAAGCILVYDVTRRQTFINAKQWLDDIREQAPEDISICLVGNKCDLEDAREVSQDEASQWALDNGIAEFVETSAKTGQKVVEAYTRVAQAIHKNIVSGRVDVQNQRSGIKANQHSGLVALKLGQTTSRSGCC